MPGAGANVRGLALRRRFTAIQHWSVAALFPVAIVWANQSLQLTVPLWLGLVGLPLILLGRKEWIRANQADQGAAAEEDVARMLKKLPRNWRVEYGLKDRRVGDIDIVVVAPDGRAWAIDVKSHAGTVICDGQTLQRQLRGRTMPFEADFLEKSRRQAKVAKELLKLRWVEPVLCFTRAQVDLKAGKVGGVYVVPASELLNLLN